MGRHQETGREFPEVDVAVGRTGCCPVAVGRDGEAGHLFRKMQLEMHLVLLPCPDVEERLVLLDCKDCAALVVVGGDMCERAGCCCARFECVDGGGGEEVVEVYGGCGGRGRGGEDEIGRAHV